MCFCKWTKWDKRNNLDSLKYPGVYVIAYSTDDISENNFGWIEDIVYIGMTNSKKGLKSRLQQFENTISGKYNNHGGAKRVIFKYDYGSLKKNLYVSVRPFKCDVSSDSVKDLLVMGKVAEYEYICFSKYVEQFKCLPMGNNRNSPKK